MLEAIVERVRKDIPALAATRVYLNTGTLGPSPRQVTEAFFKAYSEWQQAGPGYPVFYHAAHDAVERARQALASFLNVPSKNLALTSNSTDGVNIVLAGLCWQPGDEVIISDQEHPAVYVPWMRLQKTHGVRGLVLKLDNDPRVTLDRLGALLSRRTRLVLVSHVTSMTGLVLPVAKMAEMAHSQGALFMLDGAQACGNIEVDVPSTGADFYAMNGHKWLLAPVGTGALYLSDRGLSEVEPVFVGGGSNQPVNYLQDLRLEYVPGARRFENATRNWPLFEGLVASLEYLNSCGGIAAISRRSRDLYHAAHSAFSAIRGVTVLSPLARECSSGLLTVKVHSRTGQEAFEKLREQGVVSRPVSELDAVRFSFAFFNTFGEVEHAAKALRLVAW